MALTEEKKLEMEKLLREANLMGEEDTIEEHTAGDYYPLTGQVRGNYYFTKERVIFVSGWGVENFSLKYSGIRGIKKCFIGPFFPFGVKVTVEIEENGKTKTKKYKFSLMKRNYWIELLEKKSGVSCQ